MLPPIRFTADWPRVGRIFDPACLVTSLEQRSKEGPELQPPKVISESTQKSIGPCELHLQLQTNKFSNQITHQSIKRACAQLFVPLSCQGWLHVTLTPEDLLSSHLDHEDCHNAQERAQQPEENMRPQEAKANQHLMVKCVG